MLFPCPVWLKENPIHLTLKWADWLSVCKDDVMTWVNLSLYPSLFLLVPCLSFYRRGHSSRACQHCVFLLSSPRFYAERKRAKESKSVCVCGEMWLMKTWFTWCGLLRVPDVSQTLSLAQHSPHAHLMALWTAVETFCAEGKDKLRLSTNFPMGIVFMATGSCFKTQVHC